MASNKINIAVIPGDGIGTEVIPEGLRVLNAAADRYGLKFSFDQFNFSSCDYYQQHGQMMPDNWKDQIGGHDAIFFGAVGWPDTVPDHVSLWGSLLQFRREFDQYVSLRPAKLMPGVTSPLAGRGPGDIDMMIVRENTEGEYSSIGGKMFPGTDREIVMQETVMSRVGVDRILRYAFELAQKRGGKLTSATIGIAPSGNINPERKFPSLFEPVHGSAPDIAGKGIANPIGQIWSGAMMLEHLGHPEAAQGIMTAIEAVLTEPKLRTGDLGGTADTVTCGKAIAAAI
jgi:isocitrate/isopropylmalate dehydrogenase